MVVRMPAEPIRPGATILATAPVGIGLLLAHYAMARRHVTVYAIKVPGSKAVRCVAYPELNSVAMVGNVPGA